MDRDAQFPLEAHPSVVKRLNLWLGNKSLHPDVKERLERMKVFSPLIRKELASRGLPQELLAVPYVETGFENHPGNRNGTGLWMFTKATAGDFGLTVKGKQDDRLDPVKSTQAAAKVLENYHERFDNWLLALAAYNQGPSKVRRAIDRAGTNDVWTLIAQGHLNRYVEKVVAAAALIKYPSLREHI